ncbi:MAG: redoxin domain-containing protein [Planctomycetes bacterium]|nr:redoxin domain-containing protein [Planctomycetota bacterium]
MVTTLCLLGCILTTAQPAPLPPTARPQTPLPTGPREAGTSWQLTPKLTNAQELVYRGSFSEQALGSVQFSRSYRLETRVFVLGSTPEALDVAILTVLRDRPASGTPTAPAKSPDRPEAGDPSVCSARLERVAVDPNGRLSAEAGVSLAVPLEGPPTLECGAFVATHRGRVVADRPWTLGEAGRPDWRWQAAGTEVVNAASCLKLVGVQQSDDWESPRGDRAAWRRTDTVWVAPRTGVASQVRRVIERRRAGHTTPTQQSVLQYTLQSSPQYPAGLADAPRRDIEQAGQFLAAARPYLGQPARFGRELTALLARIDAHLQRETPTPYREAIVQVRARVDAARRGETPPALPSDVTDPTVPVAPTAPQEVTTGRPAPDFVAPDFADLDRSASLRDWKGRPLLMVFYNPDSRHVDELMQLVESVVARHKEVAVAGLAMAGDAEQINRQRRAKGWKFPVLDGSGLCISYAVSGTPKMVLIGANGIVRATVVGWGDETAKEVYAELPGWLGR